MVSASHAATELAAHELIQKTMGTSTQNALGMGTIARPRRPMRRSRGEHHASPVHHVRSLMHSLIHLPPDASVDQQSIVDVFASVLNHSVQPVVVGDVDEESDKENSNAISHAKGPIDQCSDHREQETMFSRVNSLDYMMVSPSHRNFGNIVADIGNISSGGGATRSILDLSLEGI